LFRSHPMSRVVNEVKNTLSGRKEFAMFAIGASALGVGLAWLGYRAQHQREAEEVPFPLPLRETKNNPELQIDLLANKQSLENVDWDGKRVLMRVDYNVPVENGVVVDRARVEGTLDTLRYLLKQKGPKGGVRTITLITHLGQPGGNYKKEKYSLKPVIKVLQDFLPNVPIKFLDDSVGPQIVDAVNKETVPGTIFLCENLRFHLEETGKGINEKQEEIKASKSDIAKFSKELSKLGDIFVFEAFGAAHRPHASIVGIDLPQRVAGLLMKKELSYYAQILGQPKRPFLAILGGSKISDKIKVIFNLLDLVDEMIIGGGMAYTFKKVIDHVEIGNSLFDKEGAEQVEAIIKRAKEKKSKFIFLLITLSPINFLQKLGLVSLMTKWVFCLVGWHLISVPRQEPLTRQLYLDVRRYYGMDL